ncbi:MAG: RDD family protein [Tissierellia bacterium]|nr:RDD family protein [Tissierellia bacterium]
MEGLINFKKHFNYLKRKLVLNNYYNSVIKKGKNIQATLLDFIFVLFILMITFTIIVFKLTKDIFLALTIGIVIGLTYLVLLILWNRRTKEKRIIKINEEIADSELIKEIEQKDNREFLLFMKDILERYYNANFYEGNRYIDFIGEINGEIYGVKCIKLPIDSRVDLDKIEFFNREIKKKNINEGIIVTNAYFKEELKNKTNYILIDFDRIKQILKEIGSYPTQKDIEDLIISRFENKKDMIKEKLISKDKSKILKFMLLGIVLILYSPFVSYTLYYKIMGFLSISIALILSFYNIVKIIRLSQRKT